MVILITVSFAKDDSKEAILKEAAEIVVTITTLPEYTTKILSYILKASWTSKIYEPNKPLRRIVCNKITHILSIKTY